MPLHGRLSSKRVEYVLQDLPVERVDFRTCRPDGPGWFGGLCRRHCADRGCDWGPETRNSGSSGCLVGEPRSDPAAVAIHRFLARLLDRIAVCCDGPRHQFAMQYVFQREPSSRSCASLLSRTPRRLIRGDSHAASCTYVWNRRRIDPWQRPPQFACPH